MMDESENAPQPGNHCLRFNFSEEALRALDELKALHNHSDRAETIRHALRLFQFCGDHILKGGKILFEEDGVMRRLIMRNLSMSDFEI